MTFQALHLQMNSLFFLFSNKEIQMATSYHSHPSMLQTNEIVLHNLLGDNSSIARTYYEISNILAENGSIMQNSYVEENGFIMQNSSITQFAKNLEGPFSSKPPSTYEKMIFVDPLGSGLHGLK